MSDNLEWRNRHGVLYRHQTVQDAVEKEKYKLTSDLEPFVTMNPMRSEDFVTALMAAGRHKEVCEFLPYALHRRVAVWWAYSSLVTLLEELDANPPVERDIADIGKPKPMTVPDWAKMPDLEKMKAESQAEIAPKLKEVERQAQALVDDVRAMLPQEYVKLWDDCMAGVDKAFKEKHGVSMLELVRRAAEKDAKSEIVFDKNSPIYKEVDAMKAQIEQMRQETVAHIKSVLPKVDLKRMKKLRDDAMQAVYRWVVSPDEVNTKLAFEIGNECTDQPAGLLALAASWSFGDMNPEGKTTVPTPDGLAANGVSQVLLKAALAKGGTRKTPERFQLYAELGVEVSQGKHNWADTVEEGRAPHVQPFESLDQKSDGQGDSVRIKIK